MNAIAIDDTDARITITELPSRKRRILVEAIDETRHVPFHTCETSYPVELITQIHKTKGFEYLCDEILRDESPDYLQHDLKWSVLSYIGEENFRNKWLLDFGCGSGSSSMVLARMFPDTGIVGIELEERLLEIARLRTRYYGFENVTFHRSPAPSRLPDDIGAFDFVMFSAVYEHLLPQERRILLPLIWNVLKPGGVLFLNATPNKYFPVEMHTTGLPLINYLPDRYAHWYARKLSRRNLESNDWPTLLRQGIRGASIPEILGILHSTSCPPILLEPKRLGIKDRIDLWYALSSRTTSRYMTAKKLFRWLVKPLKAVTTVEFLPDLSLAIEKGKPLG